MADEEEKSVKKTAPKKTTTRKAPAAKTGAVATAPAAKTTKAKANVSRGTGLAASTPGVTLSVLRENKGARPKRVRIGRGHGSGMVKTGGEGGKGQTVRSGGGKGPAFEGGQTPWARRLPHRRGYSQKARDIGHFRTRYAVVNLAALSGWDTTIEITPQTLIERNVIKQDPRRRQAGERPAARSQVQRRRLLGECARGALGRRCDAARRSRSRGVALAR
jgi:large subunit ribosomal protein L15